MMKRSNWKHGHFTMPSRLVLPLAIVMALVLGGVLLACSGYSPIAAYGALLRGSFGNINALAEVLVKTTPLLLASLGLIISSRAQFISIGSEGQIYLGAMGAAAVGLFDGELPPVIAIPTCMIAAVAISALWGGLAGWLKVRLNANEVIVTLMMNYVAIELVRYFVNGPWRDPNSVEPFTAQIMASAWLPKLIPRTRLHIGILIALAMTILFWWLIHHTTFGYRLTVCGASPEAAIANGINSRRMIILSMLISGGMSGLAGSIELMGIHHRLIEDISPNYGFTAIIIAILGRGEPIRVLFAAFFFAVLTVGADGMRMELGIPTAVGSILQALVLMFALGSEIYERRLQKQEQIRFLAAEEEGA